MRELIEQLYQAKEDSGLIYSDLETASGVGISTIKRWFGTRRMPPRMENFIAVARVLGYELRLVRVVDKPESE